MSSVWLSYSAEKYCAWTWNTTIAGNIMAGYYWKSVTFSSLLSTDTSAFVEADQRYGLCTTENYWQSGTDTPSPCPAGTYNDALMGAALYDWKP